MNLKELDNPRKTFGLVWAAELIAPAIYVIIGHTFINSAAIPSDKSGILLVALMATGALVFIAGFVFPQMRLSDSAILKKENVNEAQRYVFSTALIALGMFETVPLLALVWGFIAGDVTYLVPSAVIAMIAIIYTRGHVNMCFDRIESIFIDRRQ